MKDQTTTESGKKGADKRPITPIRKKDLLFKIVAKARAVYLALVLACLPRKWLKLLDLDKAVLIDTVSVDASLRARLGDLVLKIPFVSGNGNLALGFEQQTQGTFPPERGLGYQVRFLKAARKADPDGGVTAVCVIVIFSDKMPGSQEADIFAGLSQEEKRLARATLGTVIPVELGKIPNGQLRKKGMAGVLLRLLKHRRGEPMLPLLEPLWADLRAFKQEEQGRECVEAVVNHALLAAPEKEKDDILKRVEEELGPEEEEVGMTVASALIREGLEKGLEKGLEQGLEKGRLEGELNKALETARNLLVAGVDLQVISKATGLPRQKL
ncbi:MAG: Rpn family recombination-promoting nuclease/putative transposase, partial [Myxococcota bacterium]